MAREATSGGGETPNPINTGEGTGEGTGRLVVVVVGSMAMERVGVSVAGRAIDGPLMGTSVAGRAIDGPLMGSGAVRES